MGSVSFAVGWSLAGAGTAVLEHRGSHRSWLGHLSERCVCVIVLRLCSCKAPAGGWAAQGRRAKQKMFCSFPWWPEIKKAYQNQKQFSHLGVR